MGLGCRGLNSVLPLLPDCGHGLVYAAALDGK